MNLPNRLRARLAAADSGVMPLPHNVGWRGIMWTREVAAYGLPSNQTAARPDDTRACSR